MHGDDDGGDIDSLARVDMNDSARYAASYVSSSNALQAERTREGEGERKRKREKKWDRELGIGVIEIDIEEKEAR